MDKSKNRLNDDPGDSMHTENTSQERRLVKGCQNAIRLHMRNADAIKEGYADYKDQPEIYEASLTQLIQEIQASNRCGELIDAMGTFFEKGACEDTQLNKLFQDCRAHGRFVEMARQLNDIGAGWFVLQHFEDLTAEASEEQKRELMAGANKQGRGHQHANEADNCE